ncbi:MAG: tetratricopeptide repeat protein [Sphingobacteriales bacterium]|nr:MAG: tetratricopeptide repeat protein [Sphingobacteriales bacterium]
MKQMHIKYTLTFFFLVCSYFSFATPQYTYQYTAGCKKAYDCYLSLRLGAGNAAIKQEVIANPYNLMATYIADYDDCMLLLFNGDKNDFAQRKAHQDERLALLSKGNENSPLHRFCQAGIYLHWAFVNVRFGEDWKAAMLFRKSFILLKENRGLFPQFDYNNVFFSMEEAVVGAIPDNYKWVASIFGMKGNIKHGVGELEKFVNRHNSNDLLYNEAVFYYCYLKFYLQSQQQETWNFLNSASYNDDNLMSAFVKANIAVNYRKADDAIRILNEVARQPEYSSFPIFEYEMGCAYHLKLDSDANTYFQKYVQRFKGRIFVKDAWQKMALQYYLQHNMKQAQFCRDKIKQVGSTQVDADKQAQRFAENTDWPDITLLQSRLLFDGGYYPRSVSIISTKKETDFPEVNNKLEYNFRSGRIYDESGQHANAEQYYRRAIALGKDRKEYFAARAALQLGLMFERLNKYKDAVATYQLCLTMKGHDFQNSIDQQAKAGLNRLTIK